MKYWLRAPVYVLLFPSGLTAQAVSPSVIASDGGSGTAGGVQIDYTLGELAVDGLTGQPLSMTEGFHQPILQVEIIEGSPSVPDHDADSPAKQTITITPNPVAAELTITFSAEAPGAVGLDVFDANGILISQHKLDPANGDIQLDMSPYAAGLYFFQFTSADPRSASTYKIVKIQ